MELEILLTLNFKIKFTTVDDIMSIMMSRWDNYIKEEEFAEEYREMGALFLENKS